MFTLLAEVKSYDQTFYRVTNLNTGRLYKFQVSAVNAIGEGPLSAEISSYAKSLPGTPRAPYVTSSIKSGPATADVTISWYPLLETGGVPLTGYKLYQIEVSTSTTTLVYDGTNIPAVT